MITAIQGTRPIQTTPILTRPGLPTAPSQLPAGPVDQMQRTAAVGAIPASIGLFATGSAATLDAALAKLVSCPTEENSRAAQAGFRVGIRAYDLQELTSLQSAISSHIKAGGDYRMQKFLAEIQVDVFMEIHAKGGKPNLPPLTTPPSPGSTPQAIVGGSLKQLDSCTSEANFKLARGGFRIALRDLSSEDLNRTKALVDAAIQTTGDYRHQVFLDNLLEDVLMEQASRGLNPAIPQPAMPPALGKAPAEIAANALKLLAAGSSQAQFRTAVAAVRVAARDLDKAQTAALKAELVKAMASTSDYRTQVFLDKVSREMF